MRVLSVTVLLLMCFAVRAQLPCVAFQDLNGGVGTYPRAIATDADGSTYIAGPFADSITFGAQVIHGADWNIYVARFDPANQLAWCSVIAQNTFSVALALALDGTGGLLVAGDFMDQLTIGTCTASHPGGSDIFVTRLNAADGACQWFTTGNCIGDAHARALTIAADGTLRLVGGFHGYCTFGSTTLVCTGTMSPFVAAYAADGSALWAQQVADGIGGQSEGVSTDAAGNTYMVGSHGSTGNFGNGIFLSPAGQFVAKYNAAGVAQWARQGFTTGQYVGVVCSDGGVYVHHNNPTGIVKFNADGDTLWNRTWSGYAPAFGMSDEHAWLALSYTTQQAIGTATLTATSNTNKVALAELDEEGDLVGLYGFDNQGLSREIPSALCFDADGVPVVGGSYRCTTTNQPDTVLGLSYFVADPNASAPFILRACNSTGIAPAQHAPVAFSLFPNPANTSLTVRYELPPGIDGARFSLFDPLGRVVRHVAARGHAGQFELDLLTLPPGSYAGRITTNAGALPAQHMLVVR